MVNQVGTGSMAPVTGAEAVGSSGLTLPVGAESTGFFLLGKLIEFDKTEVIFKAPARKETEDYITGRFG